MQKTIQERTENERTENFEKKEMRKPNFEEKEGFDKSSEEHSAKKIVIPGEIIGKEPLRPGYNSFAKNGLIYSSVLGIVSEGSDRISVVALEGKYFPVRNDFIIGIVAGEKHAGYDAEINSFFQSFLLKMSLRQDMAIGSLFSAIVSNVNEVNQIDIDQARPFFGGELIVVSPVKVPRIIGKNESMLNVLRDGTKCQIFVGKNGFIWVNGGNIKLLHEALHKIETEAHLPNLTNSVKAFLEKKTLHELKNEVKKPTANKLKSIESEEKEVEQKLENLSKEKKAISFKKENEKKENEKKESEHKNAVSKSHGLFDEIAQSIKRGL